MEAARLVNPFDGPDQIDAVHRVVKAVVEVEVVGPDLVEIDRRDAFVVHQLVEVFPNRLEAVGEGRGIEAVYRFLFADLVSELGEVDVQGRVLLSPDRCPI